MPVNIKQANSGWLEALIDRYKGGAEVAVGLPRGSDGAGVRYPNGTDLLDVAYYNELGIGVPERAFIRAGVRSNLDKINDLSAELVPEINEGKIDLTTAGEAIGLLAAAGVKQFIIDLETPPNAPSTVKAKGSSNPLVDTGLLNQSITHEVREK